MIIPVGINHVIRRVPVVTIAIIAICTLVQIYADEWAPTPSDVRQALDRVEHADSDEHMAELAQEAERLAERIPIVRFGYVPGSGMTSGLIISAFVHVGWLHLIGNMLFLWLAGAALEDRWGTLRFAGFYLAGAAASALSFDLVYSGPATILVGASGAISALMGAFLVNFARMQIHFAYVFMRGIGTFDVVAYVALPLWLGEQLLQAWMQSDGGQVASVAFTAHIGGFAFGFLVSGLAKLVAARSEVSATPRRPPKPSARPATPIVAPKPESPPRDPGGGPTMLR
jgi:membrane associated rhomboid family serine protease